MMRHWQSVTTRCTARQRTTSKAADPSLLGQPPAEAAMNAASAFSFASAAVRPTAALSFVVLGLMSLGLAACGDSGAAKGPRLIGPDVAQIRCLNSSSGAPWLIVLDRPHGLADGQPASFSDAHVHSTTPSRATDLDTASGVLTVNRGSSTGGWVSTFDCRGVGLLWTTPRTTPRSASASPRKLASARAMKTSSVRWSADATQTSGATSWWP